MSELLKGLMGEVRLPVMENPSRIVPVSALRRSALLAFVLAILPVSVSAQDDASLCLITAERVDVGETLTAAERNEAHEACLRALAATASVVQKYQFQEADFAITGTREP